MSPTRTCPRCRTTFSADIIDAQVGGVCPRCLFQLVMGESGDITLKAPSTDATDGAASDLPKHMGNYEILGMLGAGGMGKVYKAKQRGLDRFVAIKVLGGGGQEEIERFFREARASARLHHPNIIPIHEVVSHEGRYFYAMDFVDGKTLERAVKDGVLPLRQGLEILAKTARAIHFAHENGVIHRDIKPANILLDGRGEPMVADFGLAKDISSEAGLTQSGYLLGTPSYMAPEQAEPDRKGEVDSRSDVYSLGATLYYLLTGRAPHEGRSVYEVIAKVVGSDPASPRSSKPETPRDVETICLKALRRDRASRYASAKEFADDLERWLKGEPILARPIGFVESLALKAKRHRRPILAGAAAAVLALGSILMYQHSRPAYLRIVTQPPGAEVELNGRRVEGVTPLADVRVPAGRVAVTLRRSGHRLMTRTLNLEPGTRFPLDLTLPRSTGRLSLLATPEGCAVSLTTAEGEARDLQCPVDRAEIPAGSYRFRISRENYIDDEGSFALEQDGEISLLRSLEPRLVGSFKTQEQSLRGLLFSVQNADWCVLTGRDRYFWTGSFPIPNPKGKPPSAGIADLLLTVPLDGGPPGELIALFARNDGAVEAIPNVYYDAKYRVWTYRMENGPVAAVLPVARPNGGHRLLFVGSSSAGADPSTPLHLVSMSDGSAIWKTSVRGSCREARPVQDVDGDGQEDLLVWGEGASILSGKSGKEILAVAGASRTVLAAGMRGGDRRAIVFATPEGCASLEIPGGGKRWEKPNPSGAFGAASVLETGGRTDLLVLRDHEIQRLDGDTGREVWSREDVQPQPAEPHILHDADLDGVPDLVFRDKRHLACVSGADGRTMWMYTLPRLGQSRLTAMGSIDFGSRGGKIAVALQSGEFMELSSAVRFEARELLARNLLWLRGCVAVESGTGGFPELIVVDDETINRRSVESGRTVWSNRNAKGLRELLRVPGTGVLLTLFGDPLNATVRALSEADGRSLWEQVPEAADPKAFAVPRESGPPGILLAAPSGSSEFRLTCREAVTGRVIWTRTLAGAVAGVNVGEARPHPVVVTMLDRAAEPGLPDLNGRALILSAEDGRTLKTLPVCIPGPEAECILTDLDGDGVADLVLVASECAQGVNVESGRILWMRYFPFLDGNVYVRKGKKGKEIILSGGYTHAILARDGTLLRSISGTVRAHPGDRWIMSPVKASWSFSQIDPETFQVTGQAYERGIYRQSHDRTLLVYSGDRLFRMGVGQGLLEGAGVVHLLPLSFDTPGVTMVRQKGPGGMVELPYDVPGEGDSPKDYPNTPRGAAESFLHGIYHYDGLILRDRTILEGGGDWPSTALVNLMGAEARSGLVEWILNRPQHLRFTGDLYAEVREVQPLGDEAKITLDRRVGGLWETLQAKKVNGTWKIVLRFTVDDIRTLNRLTDNPAELAHVSKALKGICVAEADFKENDRDKDGIKAYWTADLAGLYSRENAKLIEPELAKADGAPLSTSHLPQGGSPVPFHGYLFRSIAQDASGKPYALDLNRDGIRAENELRFGFCATPATYPGSGRLTLIVSEDKTIWMKDTQGKPVDRFPAIPVKEGWARQF